MSIVTLVIHNFDEESLEQLISSSFLFVKIHIQKYIVDFIHKILYYMYSESSPRIKPFYRSIIGNVSQP